MLKYEIRFNKDIYIQSFPDDDPCENEKIEAMKTLAFRINNNMNIPYKATHELMSYDLNFFIAGLNGSHDLYSHEDLLHGVSFEYD